MNAPTITILKTGTFTDSSGQVVTFSDADLRDVVASYDSGNYPAPLVIGHPNMDDPAYGWVKALNLANGRVQATAEKLEPTFAESVRAGRYRNVSASLYPAGHPGNPKPGRWYLKHVGFLGAAAPAIKGLGQVAFGADDKGVVSLPAALCKGIQTHFKLPCGKRMECDSAELVARAEAVRTECGSLSFADAVEVAMLDVALNDAAICFGSHDPDSIDGRRVISYRMRRARLIDPSLTFSDALALAQPGGAISFAAPSGYSAAPHRAELYRAARALMMREPGLGIAAAASRIERQG